MHLSEAMKFADIPVCEFQLTEDWLLAFINLGAPLACPIIHKSFSSSQRIELMNRAYEKILKNRGNLLIRDLLGLKIPIATSQEKNAHIAHAIACFKLLEAKFENAVFYDKGNRFDMAWENLKVNIESDLYEYQTLRFIVAKSIQEASDGLKRLNGNQTAFTAGFEIADIDKAIEEFSLLLLTLEKSTPSFTEYSRIELLAWIDVLANKPSFFHNLSKVEPIEGLTDPLPAMAEQNLPVITQPILSQALPVLAEHESGEKNNLQRCNQGARASQLNPAQKSILQLLQDAPGAYVTLDEINEANKTRKFIKLRRGNYSIKPETVRPIIKKLNDVGYSIKPHPDGGAWCLV